MIRSEGNDRCKAGLFVCEKRGGHDIHKGVLEHLQLKSRRGLKRAIDWLSFGPDVLFRFWEKGEYIYSLYTGFVMHSYELSDLGQAYFVSNVVWDVSRGNSLNMPFARFPIEGGKEHYRKWYALLFDNEPIEFRG